MPEIIVKLGDKIVQRHAFDKDVISIGRARDNDIVIENLSVSRNHSRIRLMSGKYVLTDLNSANGTLVNSVRVTKTEVVDGDEIQVGKHVLVFTESSAAPSGNVAVPSPVPVPKSQTGSPDPASQLAPPSDVPVVDLPQPALLICLKGKQANQKFKVRRSEASIGRSPENDVRIHDFIVGKKHALITWRNSRFYLRDLQSWRGTTLNGTPVKGEVPLNNNDEIAVGSTVLRFLATIPAEMEGEVESARLVPLEPEPLSDSFMADVNEPAPQATATSVPLHSPPVPPPRPTAAASAARQAEDADDEFSPISDAELEALESEEPATFDSQERQVMDDDWESMEMENMASMGERIRPSSDEEEVAEKRFVRDPNDSLFDNTDNDFLGGEKDEEDEEKALFGGAMEASGKKGVTDDSQRLQVVPQSEAPKASLRPTAPPPSRPATLQDADSTGAMYATPIPDREISDEERQAEIRIWERGLKNASPIIRKQAAKELKRLTGKDYDWQ